MNHEPGSERPFWACLPTDQTQPIEAVPQPTERISPPDEQVPLTAREEELVRLTAAAVSQAYERKRNIRRRSTVGWRLASAAFGFGGVIAVSAGFYDKFFEAPITDLPHDIARSVHRIERVVDFVDRFFG